MVLFKRNPVGMKCIYVIVFKRQTTDFYTVLKALFLKEFLKRIERKSGVYWEKCRKLCILSYSIASLRHFSFLLQHSSQVENYGKSNY